MSFGPPALASLSAPRDVTTTSPTARAIELADPRPAPAALARGAIKLMGVAGGDEW